MNIELEILVTSLLLVALAFLATVDMAFGHLSDVGLRRLILEAEERPSVSARLLREIRDNRPRFRFTVSAAIQTLLVGIAVLVTSISWRFFPEKNFILIAFVIGGTLAIIFRQFIPRLLSLRNPERTLLLLLPVFQVPYRMLSFIAIPWHKTFDRLRGDQTESETGNPAEAEETDEDDIQALIDVGEEEGILEEEEGELIHSIIEFGDTTVNEVMTPRTEIVGVPITATVRETRDVMIESKYSRLPVYREQIDNIEGVVYVRDLLPFFGIAGREDEGIESLLRPAYFVPETKPVADLLEEMQKAHAQLALVIDEYGGLAGLVTVEDILEEIVGEIEDEDTEEDEIVEIVESNEGGYYDVRGSTEVGKIERLFDMEIEDDDFTTIAGLVVDHLNRVPPAGTTLEFRGLNIEVLESDDRRISRLRLRRAAGKTANAE
jgi:putative hemolysin